MSVLADSFILLSFPGCHGIQCYKLCDINGKKKGLARHSFATQLHCYLCTVLATHFSPRNRLIYRRKTKNDKNFMMRMLELFMEVYKLVDIRH